jgi:hypothetical protein
VCVHVYVCVSVCKCVQRENGYIKGLCLEVYVVCVCACGVCVCVCVHKQGVYVKGLYFICVCEYA